MVSKLLCGALAPLPRASTAQFLQLFISPPSPSPLCSQGSPLPQSLVPAATVLQNPEPPLHAGTHPQPHLSQREKAILCHCRKLFEGVFKTLAVSGMKSRGQGKVEGILKEQFLRQALGKLVLHIPATVRCCDFMSCLCPPWEQEPLRRTF